jgi:hypothetical protein
MADLGFRGRGLTAVDIGYTVLFSFDGGHEIRVESEFTLYDATGEHRITPDPAADAAGLHALVGTTVLTATAEDNGRLRLDFFTGEAIRVEPDENYEAWTYAGPNGAKVISQPGGELAVWSAVPPGNETS